MEECEQAAARRTAAAAKYRPDRVRLLLVAQMPPDELDGYFYFEDVATADYLFRAVVPHLVGEEPLKLGKAHSWRGWVNQAKLFGLDEVEEILSSIPDLRPALASYGPDELIALFDAYDVVATYDKANRQIEVGANLKLFEPLERKRPAQGRPRSLINSIAGAGFEPATFGL